MSRSAKILAVVFAISLAVATSIYAYAQSTCGTSDTGTVPQQATKVGNEDASGCASQVRPDDEAAGSQEAMESEAETEGAEAEESEAAESANDPVEAPGTPGYEEGDFNGQHEFK
ncbi:MAG: hypothetical protein ACM3ZO_00695 [Clostridia bacterium]